MNEKQILKKLKDDQEYYNGVGKNYLSNSNIQALTTDPRQFQAPQKDGEAFVKGRFYHQLILEKNKAKDFPIVEANSRSTKVYKEFVDENNLDYALLTKDADSIKDMVKHTLSNLKFFELINDPTAQYEVPAISNDIMGVPWKGKADILVPGKYVIDLKTSGDVLSFSRNALKYNYHTQAYLYQILFKLPVIFIVIGKTKKIDKKGVEYYDKGLFQISPEAMGMAEEKVGQAVASYNKWFAPDSKDSIEDYIINMNI
jgi:hypothetical protein